MRDALYIKAKKEFEAAFAAYSSLMQKHFGIAQGALGTLLLKNRNGNSSAR